MSLRFETPLATCECCRAACAIAAAGCRLLAAGCCSLFPGCCWSDAAMTILPRLLTHHLRSRWTMNVPAAPIDHTTCPLPCTCALSCCPAARGSGCLLPRWKRPASAGAQTKTCCWWLWHLSWRAHVVQQMQQHRQQRQQQQQPAALRHWGSHTGGGRHRPRSANSERRGARPPGGASEGGARHIGAHRRRLFHRVWCARLPRAGRSLHHLQLQAHDAPAGKPASQGGRQGAQQGGSGCLSTLVTCIPTTPYLPPPHPAPRTPP